MTLERWATFSKRDQIGHIASEVVRAQFITDEALRKSMLEKALFLIDLTVEDEKWRSDILQILSLRNAIAEAYLDEKKSLEKIYAAL